VFFQFTKCLFNFKELFNHFEVNLNRFNLSIQLDLIFVFIIIVKLFNVKEFESMFNNYLVLFKINHFFN